MARQTLRSGSIPPSTLKVWGGVLAAIAVLLRLSVHFASGRAVPAAPAGFREYLTSSDFIWSSPPLPGLLLGLAHLFTDPMTVLIAIELVAVVTVVALTVRLGERWLDYRVGLMAAAAWAFCGPAVGVFRVPGAEGWQAALSILCAAATLRVARRRAPTESWRIGLSAGLLTLFSGGGVLWLAGAAGWLPWTSRKFRGREWLILVGLMLAGWAAVVLPVVIRNAVLTGGEPVLPMAEDAARFYVAMTGPVLAADPDFSALADSALVAHGIRADASEWTRAGRLTALGLASGPGWGAMGRRLVALVGGWLPPVEDPAWVLPWWWLTLCAWMGVVALIPGIRFNFPLLLGGLVPLLRGMCFGLDPGTALMATPFVCLYAGYGIWRVVTGRRSLITWMVLPVVFLVAVLVHLSVRGWH